MNGEGKKEPPKNEAEWNIRATEWQILANEYGKPVVKRTFKRGRKDEPAFVSQGAYDAKRTCIWCGGMVDSPDLLEAHEIECSS